MKRTPLRRVSKKRAKENRERSTTMRSTFGQYPDCAVCPILWAAGIDLGTRRPWHGADDAHEVLTRARGGSIVDPSIVLPTCRRAHDWIDGHQPQATDLGLLRHSWAP